MKQVAVKAQTAVINDLDLYLSLAPVAMKDDKQLREHQKLYEQTIGLESGYGHQNFGKPMHGMLESAKSVLDVGCGWNELAKHLRQKGVRAIGLDFACPGADKLDSAFLLPFEDNSFEWVTAFHLLECLKENTIDTALQEMMRVSRKFCFGICSVAPRNSAPRIYMTQREIGWWEEFMAPYASCTQVGRMPDDSGNPYLIGDWYDDVGLPGSLSGARSVAVLCPGPSLEMYGPNEGNYDIVIGVNRAAMAYKCDAWCMMDRHTYGWTKPRLKGSPVFLTTRSAWDRLRRDELITGLRVWFREHLLDNFDWCPADWKGNSSTLAVVAGYLLGPKTIDIYGMDMVGESDWDGTKEAKQNRTENRWETERRKVGALLSELNRRGVNARRILGGRQQNG